jgi:hypothetical protein
MVVPTNHPFMDGFSNINIYKPTILGYPPLMETPTGKLSLAPSHIAATAFHVPSAWL